MEDNSNTAISIIIHNIAILTKEYSTTIDKTKSKELQKKIDILNKIKDEIYLGNNKIINNILEKNKKGML